MEYNYDQHIILNTLDNPPRVLFWTLDVFLVMTIPILIGLLIGSTLFLFVGFLLKPLFEKIKRKFPKAMIKHKLYWHLPHTIFHKFGKLKSIPPSHIQEEIL